MGNKHSSSGHGEGAVVNAESRKYKRWLSKVRKDGWVLEKAPKELRGDKQLVLEAIKQQYDAIRYASTELQHDKEVVLTALKQHPAGAFCYVPDDLKQDKEMILASVQLDGMLLEQVPPQFQNDYDVVLSAVKQCGYAYQYASDNLKSNRNIVLVAVSTNGAVVDRLPADSKLRQDKDVCLAAIKSNPYAIKYIADNMKRDHDLLVAAGMFDEDHNTDHSKDEATQGEGEQQQQQIQLHQDRKKITLSTRFSLNPEGVSQATTFTSLLKKHPYILEGSFKLYSPNAFDKQSCDPNWTNFDWPCRGTIETCQYDNKTIKTKHGVGKPTDNCCWRYSFRYQLKESKRTDGFLLQLIECGYKGEFQELGKGQRIERDMAQDLELKIFQIVVPMRMGYELPLLVDDVNELVLKIKDWYDNDFTDTSECIVRPRTDPYDESN